MSDPLLQHILLLISTFDPNVKTSITPPVWEGATTEQSDAMLNAINALGIRCRKAEANLNTIQREHPDICPPSRQKSLDDHIVNSVMDPTTEASATGDTLDRTEETDHTANPSPGAGPLKNVELELSAMKEEIKLLKAQIHDITRVCTAIKRGDLGQKVEVEAEGEMLTLKLALNGLLDDLPSILSEVSRVFLEIGEEGFHGGQAIPRQDGTNLEGCWASFIKHMNRQAANITDQCRSISAALKSAASGDFACRIRYPDVRGETLILQRAVIDLLNWMSVEALLEQSE